MRSQLSLLVLLLLLQSCFNQDLQKIELTSSLTGTFVIQDTLFDTLTTQAYADVLTETFQEKLDLAHIASERINTTRATTAILTLSEPSDSSFSMFNSLTLSLENDQDSIAFAEIGAFTDTSQNPITLRVLGNNVKPLLIADTFWVEMTYSIDADTLPNGLKLDLDVEWLMTGEF